MSDAARIADLDAQIAELEAKLRAKGPGADVPKSQRRTVDEARRLEAGARPVVPGPGATPGDRAIMATKLTPEGRINSLVEKYGEGKVKETREGIKILQPDGKTWKIHNAADPDAPQAELIGSPGDVAEAAVTGARMVIPMASRVLGPFAGAAGQLAQSAIDQGVSALTRGSDEMSGSDRFNRVLDDQLFGLGGEGVGMVLSGTGKAIAKQVPSVAREANIAGKIAKGDLKGNKFSVIGEGKPTKTFLEETAETEAWVKKLTGKDLVLPEGARSGSQTALMRDAVAAGRDQGGMLDVQTQASQRGAEAMDKMVKGINSGTIPANEQTGQGLANLKTVYRDDIARRRTAHAGGLYRRADDMGALLQAKGARDAILKHIDENAVRPEIAEKLKAELEIIKGVSDKFGRIKPTDLIKLQSKWGEMEKVGLTKTEGIGTMNSQTRIASEIHKAIKADLDRAAVAGGEGITGETARTLQAANRLWGHYSERLEKLDNTLMARIEGLADDAGPDLVVKAVGQKSAAQIENYMKMVAKMDPSGKTEQTLRAQYLENIMVEEAGKAPAGQEALRRMDWGKFNRILTDGTRRQKLAAFAGGNKEYLGELRYVQLLSERLASNPRVFGSPTADKEFAGRALDAATSTMPNAGKQVADKALDVVASGRVWRGLSTVEGLRALRQAQMAALGPVTNKTMAQAQAGLAKLAAMAEQSRDETSEMKEIKRREAEMQYNQEQ